MHDSNASWLSAGIDWMRQSPSDVRSLRVHVEASPSLDGTSVWNRAEDEDDGGNGDEEMCDPNVLAILSWTDPFLPRRDFPIRHSRISDPSPHSFHVRWHAFDHQYDDRFEPKDEQIRRWGQSSSCREITLLIPRSLSRMAWRVSSSPPGPRLRDVDSW